MAVQGEVAWIQCEVPAGEEGGLTGEEGVEETRLEEEADFLVEEVVQGTGCRKEATGGKLAFDRDIGEQVIAQLAGGEELAINFSIPRIVEDVDDRIVSVIAGNFNEGCNFSGGDVRAVGRGFAGGVDLGNVILVCGQACEQSGSDFFSLGKVQEGFDHGFILGINQGLPEGFAVGEKLGGLGIV